MKIRIRKQNQDGIVKLETSGDVKEVMINEDFFHPKNESVAIGFRGKNSSGIVEFLTQEIEELYDSIKTRIHLIISFKRLSEAGAQLL